MLSTSADGMQCLEVTNRVSWVPIDLKVLPKNRSERCLLAGLLVLVLVDLW